MHGYITQGNVVGQLFDHIPPNDMYHPDFIARIVPLPDGVSSGWVYDPGTGEFLPPGLEPPPQKDPVEALQTENALLKAQMTFEVERRVIIEDLMAELIVLVLEE